MPLPNATSRHSATAARGNTNHISAKSGHARGSRLRSEVSEPILDVLADPVGDPSFLSCAAAVGFCDTLITSWSMDPAGAVTSLPGLVWVIFPPRFYDAGTRAEVPAIASRSLARVAAEQGTGDAADQQPGEPPGRDEPRRRRPEEVPTCYS